MIDNKPVDNVRMSRIGVLYLYAIIDSEIDINMHDQYLDMYLNILNDSLIAMDLVDVIKSEKRTFTLNSNTVSDPKLKPSYFYLIKYIPNIRITFSKIFFATLTSGILYYIVYKFSLFDKLHDVINTLKF